MREPALRALEWIDRYGDRDGDGFVEYSRQVDSGLANQSWKDSGDSQRFHDGTFAEPPIAAVEVQGYVYDAKRGLAELAREVWRDQALAERLEREADELRTRFDEAFWVEERGGFYALALDGAEAARRLALARTWATCSGAGSSCPERVGAVVDQLLSRGALVGLGHPHDGDATPRRSTRSATTTARSGPTTRRSPRGASRGTATRPRRGGSAAR